MTMGRLGRWVVAAALGAGAALGGGEALAQDWIPHSRRSAVGGDVYLWPTRDLFTMSLVPFFQYEVAPHIFLDLDFPVAFADYDARPDAHLALGNPAFAIRYADTSGKLTWTAGGGAALPVASASDDLDWNLALFGAARSMGFYDLFLWAPDVLPTFGRFAFEIRVARPIYLRFFVDPVVLIPINDRRFFDGRRREFEVLMQGKFEFEARANSGPGGGIALQFVGDLTGDPYIGSNDDFDAQAAVEPFFSFDNSKLFLRVGGLIGLNRPLGPGFDRNRLFALHFNIGGHL